MDSRLIRVKRTTRISYPILVLIVVVLALSSKIEFAKCEQPEEYLQIRFSHLGPAGSVKEFNNSRVISASDRVRDLTLTCESSKCPVEWKLEKYRYAIFNDDLPFAINFKSSRTIDETDYKDVSKYKYSTEIHFTGTDKLITGNYICSCTTQPTVKRPVYLYWEGSSSTLFLQGGQTFDISRKYSSPWITIFCGASKPDVPVFLFKEHERPNLVPRDGIVFVKPTAVKLIRYESLFPNASILLDVDGFHLNLDTLPFPDGNYVCSTTKQAIANMTTSSHAKYTVTNAERFEKEVRFVTEYDKLSSQSANTVFFDKTENTLACCAKAGSPEWSQVGYWCENVQKCNLIAYKLEVGGHNARDDNGTCTSFTIDFEDLPPAATFRCTMQDVIAQGTMFFSVDSYTYFTGDPISRERVVKISTDTNVTNYLGAPIRFNCSNSLYLFSNGLIWVGTFANGTSVLIGKRLAQNYYKLERERVDQEWTIKIRILDPELHFISCLAPVWNTDEWWNSTVALNLAVSQRPSFDGLDNKAKEVFIDSGTTEVKLHCHAAGVPRPKLEWFFKDTRPIQGTISQPIGEKEVSSELKVVRPSGKDVSAILGTYVCSAINSVGSEKLSIHLQVKSAGIGIIIGITVGIIFLFTIAVVVLGRKVILQRKALRHLTEAEINEFEKGNPEALANWKDDINGCTHLLPYNTDYEVPPVDLTIDQSKILGQGTFGIVLKGYVRKGGIDTTVAVKTIRPNEDVSNFKVLLSELKIMAYIGRHENIVSLVGASSRNIRNRELMIAIEFCDNGSLFEFLRKNRNAYNDVLNPDLDSRQSFVGSAEHSYQNDPSKSGYVNQMEITMIPEYENDPSKKTPCKFKSFKKVHADLATRNILLTADLSAKIGDFGLSKHLFEYSTYTKKTMALLPWKWMAIESLRDMEFSVKSDVWSYGVLLWELFTLAEVPYPGRTWTSEFLNELTNGMRLQQPKFATPEIYEVMLKCMRPEALSRPSFTTLKEFQSKILQRVSTL